MALDGNCRILAEKGRGHHDWDCGIVTAGLKKAGSRAAKAQERG
jgi:hypothetical protein